MVQTPSRLQGNMTSTFEFLGLSATDVSTLLTVDLAIESQRRAFSNLASGEAILAERLLMEGVEDSVAFCYAARLNPTSGAVCKFGSMNPANPAQGRPAVSALVTVLDPATGVPVAVMDGTSVTTIRTSAASAVAVEALAAPGAHRLAVIGSGVQAAAHVHAIARVLPLTQVTIWSADEAGCRALADALNTEYEFSVLTADSAAAAVTETDVVATCTTSSEPVLNNEWIADGTTIVSVGSFAPNRFEIPRAIVERASAVVIDHRPTATDQAGPIVDAIAAGVLKPEDLIELGDILIGRAQARTSPDQVIYYNSVGVGIQDAAAAQAVLEAARATGLGQRFTL